MHVSLVQYLYIVNENKMVSRLRLFAYTISCHKYFKTLNSKEKSVEFFGFLLYIHISFTHSDVQIKSAKKHSASEIKQYRWFAIGRHLG